MIIEKTYKPIQKKTVTAFQITPENIKEVEKLYGGQFQVGLYILTAEDESTDPKVKEFMGSIWSKESFESNFEEIEE
jgi:hypothetical protein